MGMAILNTHDRNLHTAVIMMYSPRAHISLMAFRVIKSSLEEALKRMRDAEARLTKAQQRGRGEGTLKLAEALEEYNGCVAELTSYVKASSRQRDTDASEALFTRVRGMGVLRTSP